MLMPNSATIVSPPPIALIVDCMVVDIMVPTVCVIRSHKKKIESSPSMIFPQGMGATKVLPSAHTISN
jgi:hypothetical protein